MSLTAEDVRDTQRRLRAQFGSRHIGSSAERGGRSTGFRRASGGRRRTDDSINATTMAKIKEIVREYYEARS